MTNSLENGKVDFNILLWNLNSSDRKASSSNSARGRSSVSRHDSDRLTAIEHILPTVMEGTRIPTFFLCQEIKYHKVICDRLKLKFYVLAKEIKETCIYPWKVTLKNIEFINSEDDVFVQLFKLAVECNMWKILALDESVLQTDQVPSFPSTCLEVFDITDTTLLTHLRACIFKPKSAPHVLILSWHGPQNKESIETPKKNRGPMDYIKKERNLENIVYFAEKLQLAHKCGLAIIGGDFNIPCKIAEEHLDKLEMSVDAKVYHDYLPPKDREDSDLIDFIIVLTKQGVRHEVVETSVHHQYYKREKPRPFDHPIVRFRLVVSEEEEGEESASDTTSE